jgi:hypothetical protein
MTSVEISKPAIVAVQAVPDPAAATSHVEVALPVQTAMATAPQPFLSGHRLLVLGLLLLAVAAGLLWLIVRRSHAAASTASLITQSFDRDKDEPRARSSPATKTKRRP